MRENLLTLLKVASQICLGFSSSILWFSLAPFTPGLEQKIWGRGVVNIHPRSPVRSLNALL